MKSAVNSFTRSEHNHEVSRSTASLSAVSQQLFEQLFDLGLELRLSVIGSYIQSPVLHPVMRIWSGTRQYPFSSRLVKYKNVPGELFSRVIELLGEVVDAKSPQVPEVLNPRIIQRGGCLLGRKPVVVFKNGRPENKNLDAGVHQLLQNLADFGGPPKTVSSGG